MRDIYKLYFSWLDTETGIGGVVLNVGKHGTYRVQLCLVLEKSEFFEQQGCIIDMSYDYEYVIFLRNMFPNKSTSALRFALSMMFF